jgi:hypothetical protein
MCFKYKYSKEDRIRDLSDLLDSSMTDPINIYILGTAIINTYIPLTEADKCMIYLYRHSKEGTFLEPFAIGPEKDFFLPNEVGKMEWVGTFERFLKLVVSERKSIISNQIQLFSPYTRIIRTLNFAGVPLIFDDEIVGIVGLVRKGTKFTNENLAEMLVLNNKLAKVMWRYRKNTSSF